MQNMTTYSSRPNLVPSAPSHGASPSPGPSGSLQPGTKVQVGKYVVKVDKFLSEGGFAHVYVASLVSPSSVEGFAPTQNTFVLKRMAVPDKAGLVEVRKEVDVMKQLRPHKHVVYFIEASASSIVGGTGYEIFILMELCPGGGIIDLLNSRLQNRLTESEILKIFSDTVEAVAHMHSQTPILMHRDLKVENILVAAPNLYKLCDFGSTTTPPAKPPQSTAEIQALEADLNKHTTLQYRAPEMVDVWSRKGVTEKADIWALGVFLYKLCYYTTPFEEHGPMAILNVQYTIPSYPAYSNSIKYLIGTMLQESAHSRPDIWQVHEHTCKLRGIQPHLKRRASRALTSLGSGPAQRPGQASSVANVASQPSKSEGLDAIFTSAPSVPLVTRQADAVVPMRRGRPTTKPKDATPSSAIDTVGGSATNLDSSNDKDSMWKLPKPTPMAGAPEESDLFAREAAAGFGDSFMLTSSKSGATSQMTPAPVSLNHLHSSSPDHQGNHKPALEQRKAAGTVTPTTKPTLPFEDLLPPAYIKKAKPLSMNTMRNSRADGNFSQSNRPAKRDSFTGPSSTSSPKIGRTKPTSGTTAIGSGGLSQKTGPQSLTMNTTHETRSSHTSFTSTKVSMSSYSFKQPPQAASGRSLSELLKKDQAQLVSRSVQTSPSLLSGLIKELMPNLPSKNPIGQPSFSEKPPDDLKPPVNFLADDEDDLAASAQLGLGTRSLMKETLANKHSTANVLRNNNQFRPTPNAKPPGSNELAGEPPLPSRPIVKTDIKTHSVSNIWKPTSSSTSSSDSDDELEEPEDPEGLAKFSAHAAPMSPPLPAKSAFHSANPILKSTKEPFVPVRKTFNQLQQANTSIQSTSPIDSPAQPPIAPSTTSLSVASTSDMTTTTEEDDDIKARRRAAIAKFAPPAASPMPLDDTDRDPFSSRAQTRSTSPENRLSSMLTGSRLARNPGPPLRAPKPQSLKSAAAITSLVSRYESLSTTGDSQSPATSPPAGKNGFANKIATGLKTSTTGNGQRQTFKPTPSNSSSANKPTPPTKNFNYTKSTMSNIQVTSIAEQLEKDQEEEEPEERFNGVNNMKSKWETGAVKRAETKTRAPRTDYGQS